LGDEENQERDENENFKGTDMLYVVIRKIIHDCAKKKSSGIFEGAHCPVS
jgi:hypothetical protein